jgi:hypothetical protein
MKSKDTKLRGLKGASEDISISQEAESKGTRQNRVKRYKETPVLKSKGTRQNSVKRYKETPVKLYTSEKPQSKVYTGREKNPSPKTQEKPQSSSQKVQRGKQVKRCKSELMQLKLHKPPPPSQNYITALPTVM